jgi:hypothetical protein
LDEAPYKLSEAVAKLAGITFSRLAFSYWIDYLGFITEGKLAAIFIKPSLGRSFYFINKRNQVFWHHHHRTIILLAGILRHYGTSAGPYHGGYRPTRADIPA